ncbi:MAG: SDR family NAD(P)-dependent oxidoreductase [Caulobacterales bacterium]
MSTATRKAALVTGSGTGIGAAIARSLARQGVNVAVNHLGETDRAPAEAVAADCRAAGGEAVVLQGDVGRDEDCRRLVADAAERWGRLDYLVNNAGYSAGRPLQDYDAVEVVEFERAFAVNTIGPFLLSRYAAAHMRKSGGAIVNISSMAGLTAMGSSHGYCASKAALLSITRTMARALGPQVRVNAVCPGLVDTDHPRRVMGDRFQEIVALAARQNVLGEILQPEDIAATVVFLLLHAEQVTGEVVRVDGGGHLGGRLG